MEVTHWFQWDGNQNTGACLDEFAVVDGNLRPTRTQLPAATPMTGSRCCGATVRLTPDDALLAEAVARETAGPGSG